MYPKKEAAAAGSRDAAQEGSTETAESEEKPIYVHAPSDLKNCQTCHLPHYSAELALIVAPIQPLCGRCHDYKAASFKTAHLNIEAGLMDCRKCHAPHTSKDPKFFKAEVHPPFADRTCKDCHIVEKP
jgi:predicted CXXCH cytochrome family protein